MTNFRQVALKKHNLLNLNRKKQKICIVLYLLKKSIRELKPYNKENSYSGWLYCVHIYNDVSYCFFYCLYPDFSSHNVSVLVKHFAFSLFIFCFLMKQWNVPVPTKKNYLKNYLSLNSRLLCVKHLSAQLLPSGSLFQRQFLDSECELPGCPSAWPSGSLCLTV